MLMQKVVPGFRCSDRIKCHIYYHTMAKVLGLPRYNSMSSTEHAHKQLKHYFDNTNHQDRMRQIFDHVSAPTNPPATRAIAP